MHAHSCPPPSIVVGRRLVASVATRQCQSAVRRGAESCVPRLVMMGYNHGYNKLFAQVGCRVLAGWWMRKLVGWCESFCRRYIGVCGEYCRPASSALSLLVLRALAGFLCDKELVCCMLGLSVRDTFSASSSSSEAFVHETGGLEP